MRAVIQRTEKATVYVENSKKAEISTGLLVLLGIEDTDTSEDIEWLTGKIARLRIFKDQNGVMNLSVKDIDGEIMTISQFTLHASTKKGNRPSYIRASKPEIAIPLYNEFVNKMGQEIGKEIKTGEFGAYMKIDFVNDGPVTILIDTKNKE